MFNCSDDVLAHHDSDVTLPQADRSEMSKRRDSNRRRLKNGLAADDLPLPLFFESQGSYKMKTMVQHPEQDYDIDDGVYFAKDDLVGTRGAYLTSLQARQRVRDALDDGSFETPPEIRKNCVRVYYKKGYHVDVPVYREIPADDEDNDTGEVYYELAGPAWIRSDARNVTEWFDDENRTQSPDESNGRQLRRTVRQLKFFARSRDSWKDNILSGFGITKLVTECYSADLDREDRSLYDSMVAIRDRLNRDLEIEHPVTPGATITKGDDDPKARFFRDKLSDAIANLDPLFEWNCDSAKARKCWDKVFNTTFFSDREPKASALAKPTIVGTSSAWAGAAAASESAVSTDAGNRHA